MNYTLRLNLLCIKDNIWAAEVSAGISPGYQLHLRSNQLSPLSQTRVLDVQLLPSPHMKGGYLTVSTGLYTKEDQEQEVTALLRDAEGLILESTQIKYP